MIGFTSPEVASRVLPEDVGSKAPQTDSMTARTLPADRIRRPSVDFRMALQKEAVKKSKGNRRNSKQTLERKTSPPTPEANDNYTLMPSPNTSDPGDERESIAEATEKIDQHLKSFSLAGNMTISLDALQSGLDGPAARRGSYGDGLQTFALGDSTSRSDDEGSPGAKKTRAKQSRARTPSVVVDLDVSEGNLIALSWFCAAHKKRSLEIQTVCVNTVGGDADQSYYVVKSFMSAVGLGNIMVAIGKPFKTHMHAGTRESYESFAEICELARRHFPAGADTKQRRTGCTEAYTRHLPKLRGQAKVICLGPVCNVMALERNQLDLLSQMKEVVCVAGAFGVPGDLTAAAERNVGLRPEDFHNFLQAFEDPIIVPKDVEGDYLLSATAFDSVLSSANSSASSPGARGDEKKSEESSGRAAIQFLRDLIAILRKKQTVPGPHVQVQVLSLGAVAYALCPQHLSMRRAAVRVETLGRLCRGKTLFDVGPPYGIAPNSWVVSGGDGAQIIAEYARDINFLL